MTERTIPDTTRRKRINRIKTMMLLLAVTLVLASLILNVVLLIRVIRLDHLVEQLCGAVSLISVP